MRRLNSYWALSFFNDAAPTENYTLSLHDALPISAPLRLGDDVQGERRFARRLRTVDLDDAAAGHAAHAQRSEEHTSELQSLAYLVCRLLLEKKIAAALLKISQRTNLLQSTKSKIS